MNKCAICGAELPYDMTGIYFATKNGGIAGACMVHEFTSELENYIKSNGGSVSVLEALNIKEGEQE